MIDVKQQISAVSRTVGDRVLEAGQARVATLSQVYDTGLEDLWDAVTSAERIPRWFLPIEGDLVEGGRFQFQGNAGGTITRCDKPHGYSATWEFGGQVSWVEIRLTAEGDDRTRFELEHVAHVTDELWDQYGPAATGMGWESGFLGMANYLSDPSATLDPEAAAAWVATAEGKEFMRLSADAWAEAAIANGDDPALARASADRTYQAYTGG
ncbi:SRPBCC family protein [Winogradskya consettensis]|uniref:Activator of HSP90 ATPase n=1 Tax=Winogradskya consettensis TaxID=113560 RepID=A0A919T3L0_9ACTN|nr:SRPBCC family protein [Actinoplanes consettensis]GIM83612.1 activator of HSP90 ATPase [Actinoplanes consettensis]